MHYTCLNAVCASAQVDLAALFDPRFCFRVIAAREVSLTANQDKAALLRRRAAAARALQPSKGEVCAADAARGLDDRELRRRR